MSQKPSKDDPLKRATESKEDVVILTPDEIEALRQSKKGAIKYLAEKGLLKSRYQDKSL